MKMRLTHGNRLEHLEHRALLSAVVADRTLIVEGTEDADVIDIQTDGTLVYVRSGGTVEGAFAYADFDRMHIDALGGNDVMTIGIIIGQPATIDAGAGDDSVRSASGDDLIIAGLGQDTLDGSAGIDTLDYSARTLPIHGINSNQLKVGDELDSFYNMDRLILGQGDDSFSVFSYDNPLRELEGGAGNDTLSLGGSERTYTTAPTIRGGDGNDRINIDRAAHALAWYYGDGGDDVFTFGRNKNIRHFFGGDGVDTVDYDFPAGVARGVSVMIDDQFGDGYYAEDNVHSDVEVIRGTFYADTIIGTDAAETLLGEGGADLIIGKGGDDLLIGPPDFNIYSSRHTLLGGAGNDTLVGGRGGDVLDGGAGDDSLMGNEGDDTLIGGPGSDVFDGGAGNNIIIDDFASPPRRAAAAKDLLGELA
jgi:Ca2+-binding RTX toxin-like protein